MSYEKNGPITRALLYIIKYMVPLLVAATPIVLVILNNSNNVDKNKKESRYYAGYLRVKIDTLNRELSVLRDSVMILELANAQLNAGLAKTEIWRWEAERRISKIEGSLSSGVDSITFGLGDIKILNNSQSPPSTLKITTQ